jgi:hypothetical protein
MIGSLGSVLSRGSSRSYARAPEFVQRGMEISQPGQSVPNDRTLAARRPYTTPSAGATLLDGNTEYGVALGSAPVSQPPANFGS